MYVRNQCDCVYMHDSGYACKVPFQLKSSLLSMPRSLLVSIRYRCSYPQLPPLYTPLFSQPASDPSFSNQHCCLPRAASVASLNLTETEESPPFSIQQCCLPSDASISLLVFSESVVSTPFLHFTLCSTTSLLYFFLRPYL